MEITSYLLGKKAGGGETPTGTINITENGIKNVSNYASADVNVQPNLQSKEVSITSNGSSTISPDSNYDGLSSVSLTTNVQPNLETKSITITENTTTTLTPTSGKDGMSSVSITTNVSGGGVDWNTIGYTQDPKTIVDIYNYSKDIYDNWDSTLSLNSRFSSNGQLIVMPLVDTSIGGLASEMFYNCSQLQDIPLLDFSNVTNCTSTFSYCYKLKSIPLLNTSKVRSVSNMFNSCSRIEDIPLLDTSNVDNYYGFNSFVYDCPNLTDTSLDNILQMCINATKYGGTKTLQYVGLRSNKYPVSRIQALPHYQDFIDAGWTIGY